MKRIILLTTILGIFICNLSAQTKTEKIKELYLAMKINETMIPMFDNMLNTLQSQMPASGNTHKDSLFLAYVKMEGGVFMKKIIDVDMVEYYNKYFTTEEIQKYIDFYKTPEGQKMITVMPELMKDMMSNMMTKDLPELQVKFKKKLEELKG